MNFIIGKFYEDRTGKRWECVRPIFGSLPCFQDEEGNRAMQSVKGRYRFDDIDSDRDMINEII